MKGNGQLNEIVIVIFLLSLPFLSHSLIKNCQYYKIDSNQIARCTICSLNYQLNLNYTRCSLCSSIDPYCIRCDADSKTGALYCQVCHDGYQVIEGRCVNIDGCTDSNCNTCIQNTSQCLSCNQGYFLNPNSTACSPCKARNEFDQGNGTCVCDYGFYLSTTQNASICTACQYPCQNCKQTSNFCTLCIYGYFLNDSAQGTCSLCLTPNCILCKDQNICLNCTLGYNLVQGVCQIQLQQQNIKNYINLPEFYYFCLPGCFYCYKYDFCITCLEGYSRNLYNDACQPCSLGCKKCDSLKDMKCFLCYEGYRLINSTCQKCQDSNCLTCNNSQSKCTKCVSGFTSTNGICSPCASNCYKCDKLGSGTCDFGQCFNGYARVSNTTCALCALGCYSCNTVDISTCISCPIGSFQIVGGQCQICPSSCTTCQASTYCTACREGYRLINNLCYQDCAYPCLDCSPFNNKICSSCYNGYLLAQDMTCQPDLTCNQYQNCTICPVEYYLDIYTSLCLQCSLQANCIKCETQASKCAICSDGYYLIENTCKSCSSSCLTCQLQSYCFDCKPGYYLYKEDNNQVFGNCLPCSSNCLTCIDEFDKCNSCNYSEELIGFDCVSSQNIIFEITMQHNSLTSSNAQQFAFIKEIVPFTNALAFTFGPPYSTHPNLLFLKDISSGSIQVSYMVTITDLDPRVLLPTIMIALNSFTSFNDFTIISTQIVTNGFQNDIIIEPPTSCFVVALIPSPFFLLFLAFVVFRLYQHHKLNQEHKENNEKQALQVRLEPYETEKNLRGDEQGAITL